MTDWTINLWQRILFGCSAALLLVIAIWERDLEDVNVVPLLWAVILAAVAISSRRVQETSE